MIEQADEKKMRLNLELALNVLVRVILRADEVAAMPQLDDGGFVGDLKRANVHRLQRCQ